MLMVVLEYNPSIYESCPSIDIDYRCQEKKNIKIPSYSALACL